MKTREADRFAQLLGELEDFEKNDLALPGVSNHKRRNVFVRQLVDSIRRVEYVYAIQTRDVSKRRADPASDSYDPVLASIYFSRTGKVEDAFWQVFLATHFGKAKKSGWRLARDVYGRLGGQPYWTWEEVSIDPEKVKSWLAHHHSDLKNDGIDRYFGNHRKYETLKPEANRSTGRVIESYVEWIGPARSHQQFFTQVKNECGANPRVLFDHLYNSMRKVISFGRTARFDYLAMLGKLNLLNIEPGRTYMQSSTGPIKGARLLVANNCLVKIKCSDLEKILARLECSLSLGTMGMQILEDALCNWQKSPSKYEYFGG